MEILLTWIIFFALLPGIISAFIFSTTGRDDGELLTFAIGFLLSYFGVIIVMVIALASSKKSESEYTYDSRACPYCADKIKISAIKCRFC